MKSQAWIPFGINPLDSGVKVKVKLIQEYLLMMYKSLFSIVEVVRLHGVMRHSWTIVSGSMTVIQLSDSKSITPLSTAETW